MARCASEGCGRWRPGVLTGMSGVMVDERWFCSDRCVERRVRQIFAEAPVAPAPIVTAPAPRVRLGALLRHQGALSADQLHEALEQQQTSGLKLGAQARAMFGIERSQVLRALAAQAGTRYLTSIDPATVHDAPGGLSRETIEALGLVPFSAPDRGEVVRVASTAPIRWDAVSALRRLVGWVPEPYLVEDDTWRELFDHYGAGVSATRRVPEGRIVKDEHEAVACITRLATASRHIRLAETRWEPYTWVRVEGETSVNDVLLSRTIPEELPWQAASTSH